MRAFAHSKSTLRLSPGASVVFLVIGLILYFVPTALAWYRRVNQAGGLFALNLFLGWTVLGWIGALIWAAAAETEADARAKVIDYAKLAIAMQATQYPVHPPIIPPAPVASPTQPPPYNPDALVFKIGRMFSRLGRLFQPKP